MYHLNSYDFSLGLCRNAVPTEAVGTHEAEVEVPEDEVVPKEEKVVPEEEKVGREVEGEGDPGEEEEHHSTTSPRWE